jgi:hypothetical protein
LIDARNEYVKAGLQAAYKDKIEEVKLEVFFVSNDYYDKYCKRNDAELINESGIPELRRFCATITSMSHRAEGQHYLQSRAPSLMTSLRLWIERTQDRQGRLSLEVEEKLRSSTANLATKVSGTRY